MGINGLLPVLKGISNSTHVSNYRGQKVAVDGYCWLHKGAYCCSRELCEGTWTDRFVMYFMSRVELLRSNGVIPVIIFDGGRLPIKSEEESQRRRSRVEAREKAAAHMQAGNMAAAMDCYQRAVDISPSLAKQVIECLKEQGVSFVVAPYEADAQMAYLARRGDVHAVITEDSDLLAYGCPRVLFKMDKTGTGDEILLDHLSHSRQLSFVGWTNDMFLQLCIMAGCDFLKQLPGIGMKKAHQQLCKLRDFVKVCRSLRFSGTSAPPDYEQRFQMALWAFRHQRVYCPDAQQLVHLVPLPQGGLGAADVDVVSAIPQGEELQTLDFLGPDLPADLARGIAQGDIDPSTHQPFNLAAIYEGCPPARMPAHLRQLLQQQRAASQPSPIALPPASASGGPTSGSAHAPRRTPHSKQAAQTALPVHGNSIARYFPTATGASSQAQRSFQAPRPMRSGSCADSGTQPSAASTQRRRSFGLARLWAACGSQAPAADESPPQPHDSNHEQPSKRHRPCSSAVADAWQPSSSTARAAPEPQDDQGLASGSQVAASSSGRSLGVPGGSTDDPQSGSWLSSEQPPAAAGWLPEAADPPRSSGEQPPAAAGWPAEAVDARRSWGGAASGCEALLGQLDTEFPVSGSDLGDGGLPAPSGGVAGRLLGSAWLQELQAAPAESVAWLPEAPSQSQSGRARGQPLSALAALDAQLSGSSLGLSQGLAMSCQAQPAAAPQDMMTSSPGVRFTYHLPLSSPDCTEAGEEATSPLKPSRTQPRRPPRVVRTLQLAPDPDWPAADRTTGITTPQEPGLESQGFGHMELQHGVQAMDSTAHASDGAGTQPAHARGHQRQGCGGVAAGEQVARRDAAAAARGPPAARPSLRSRFFPGHQQEQGAPSAAQDAQDDGQQGPGNDENMDPDRLASMEVDPGEGAAPQGPQNFHGIQHVKAFADVAKAAMYQVELGVLKRFAFGSAAAPPPPAATVTQQPHRREQHGEHHTRPGRDFWVRPGPSTAPSQQQQQQRQEQHADDMSGGRDFWVRTGPSAPASQQQPQQRPSGLGKGGRGRGRQQPAAEPGTARRPFVAPRPGAAKQTSIKDQVANFQRFSFQARR